MFKSNKDYDNEVFNDLILNNTTFEIINFVTCTFIGCDLSENKFLNCVFEDCYFEKCNLSNSKFINSNFISCKFESSKILGIDFTTCKSLVGLVIECKKCDLGYSSFIGMNISKSKFKSCKLNYCDFMRTNCTAVYIDDCDLENVIFDGTNLKNATIVNCINCVFDPSKNRVTGLKLSRGSSSNLLLPFGITVVEDN